MTAPAELFDLSGRTAIVTGASAGLGVAFARGLADAGANVVLAARRKDRLDEVAAGLRADGAAVETVACDVTDTDSTDAAVAAAVDAFGGLDVVVANAGVVAEGGAMPERMRPELFARSLETNVVGTFNTCQSAAKHMLLHGGGSMITLGSVAGIAGHFNSPAGYSSSKAAVINLTKALAVHWADRGIRVNAIAPGWFRTEMTERVLDIPAWKQRCEDTTALRRLGDPDELVGALLLLASDAGRYMTGAVINVDGGMSASIGAPPYTEELYAVHAAIPDGTGRRIIPGAE